MPAETPDVCSQRLVGSLMARNYDEPERRVEPTSGDPAGSDYGSTPSSNPREKSASRSCLE
jgi:hypothetical protein